MLHRLPVPVAVFGQPLTPEQLAPPPPDAAIEHGEPLVTPAQYRARVALCEGCEHRIPTDCAPCGWGRCGYPGVTAATQPVPLRPDSVCPLVRWPTL